MRSVMAGIGARQHGVVSRRQLLAEGVPGHCIDERVASGRLRVLHRGVYQTDLTGLPRVQEAAAVLACGGVLFLRESRAVISHFHVGALGEVVQVPPPSAPIELILPVSDRRRRPGLRIHRCGPIPPDEVAIVDAIPVTTRARTLLDLALRLTARELERAVARAERNEATVREQLKALLLRHPRQHGAAALRRLLDDYETFALTRSEAEERLLLLIRKAGFPPPQVNVRVEGFEVDFLWRRERLIVEADGFAFHGSAEAFERDRLRDSILAGAGFRVARVTWRQIVDEPEAIVARLTRALDR